LAGIRCTGDTSSDPAKNGAVIGSVQKSASKPKVYGSYQHVNGIWDFEKGSDCLTV
jgi:hypothetical protein